MFITTLFTIVRIWKQPTCPLMDEWIKKNCHTYVHSGILSDLKKKEILPFAITWMNLEDIILSEVNQIPKDKYHIISHVESKIVELIETKERCFPVVKCGVGGEMLVKEYTLSFIRKVSSGDLTYR